MTTTMTWDEVAVLYKSRTGRSARIRPLNAIFEWALGQDDIEENEDGELYMIHDGVGELK